MPADFVNSFGQLAAMVSEQSEMIQRIDANTYVLPGFSNANFLFVANTPLEKTLWTTSRVLKKSCSNTGLASRATGGS